MSSPKPSPDEPQRGGFVCLTGPTNAGKSTLMNAIVGRKIAITTPKPQTTRNRILGIHTVTGRGQIVFVDTPGLHSPRGALGRHMMHVAQRSLTETDLALLVVDARLDVDAHKPVSPTNRRALAQALAAGVPLVIGLNQIDRVGGKSQLLPVLAGYAEAAGGAEVVPISARTGDGLELLQRVLFERLPEGPPLYPGDLLSDQAEHFMAAEVVREKVMLETRQELPYSVAVEVERWEEPAKPDGVLRLSVVIHVERESQKGIVIGKGGSRLKAIGQQARVELEQTFGTKVFVELFVRVEPNWTNDARRLAKLGYKA